jgi:hypothetical protein
VRFFKFGVRAYRPKIAEEYYDWRDRRGTLLKGPCRELQADLALDRDITALVASGTGLLLLRDGRLLKLFDSMGYIFGMTVLSGRVYLLHLVQVEGNYKHTEETYRRSEIYSLPIDEIMAAQPGDSLRPRREYREKGVLYSYCNAHGGLLYVVDYLGRLSVFEPDADGHLDDGRVRHVMANRHFDGSPLRRYAYTHFNTVSVAGDRVFLGAHGRRAHSGQFSGIYTLGTNLDPASLAHVATPFVHAHDTLVGDGDLYSCDSRNGTLVKNGAKLFVDRSGFMRGLSVLDDRILVGLSVNRNRRGDRNRETAGENQLIQLNAQGRETARAGIRSSQIYRILTLSEPDRTVSSVVAPDRAALTPDPDALMAAGEARDVASYYGDETPPFEGKVKDY